MGFCSGNSGDPIFTEDFGTGTTNNSLPPGTISNVYTYVNAYPFDAEYTVINGTFGNGLDWHQIPDHTAGDTNGKLLIVNAAASPGEFYESTISGLCPNTTYEFSAWVINLVIANTFCGAGAIPINVRFEIRNSTDTATLASGNTGSIGATSIGNPSWNEYGLVFNTGSETSVILKMRNNGTGGCGNDLAIDDIEFKTCGDLTIVEDASNNTSISICDSQTPYATTLTAVPDNSVFLTHFYQWQESTDGITWTDIVGETNQNISIIGITSAMYYRSKVSETASTINNAQCNTLSEAYQLTINPIITPTFTQVPAICSGDTLAALPTTSNEGIAGTWSPALDNTTTTTYTFTPNPGECAMVQNMTITVNPTITPTFTQVPGICNGDTLAALPATSNEGVTGTWSPALDNTMTTTYTFTPNSGQCSVGQTMTITVNPITTPTFAQVPAICSGDSLAALPTTSNEGVMGTWSPALDNTMTTTYTFTPNSGQCSVDQTMTITVNPIITPTFDQVLGICSGDTLNALPTTSNEGVTGTWAPALDNTMTTTYTFTSNSGQCAVGQTMTITVNPIITPTFDQVPGICSGDTLNALPTTSNEGITGTWSPALDNTMTTTYTFTPNSGQCSVGQTMTITVNPITTPTFDQIPSICSGDTLTALPTISNEGIIGTWSPALDNTMTTVYTFTPSSGQCVMGQTMTIMVNPITTPTFDQVPAICSGETLAALPATSNEGITGTWSPVPDNTMTTTYTFTPNSGQCVMAQTMTITVNPITTPTFAQVPAICSGDTLAALPTTSNEGIMGAWSPALDNTMTTTYTFTPNSGQCAVGQTMTITVNPITTPTFAQAPAICSGDTLTALPTISNEGITGTWNPALDNTMTTTYTFTPSSGQCVMEQTMTITVNPITTPTFDQVPAICSGDALVALPTTSNEGITGTWSPVPDNTMTTTYTFIPNLGQCAINQTMTIMVNPNQAPIFNQVPPICSGDTLAPLPTVSNNGVPGTWSPALNNIATTVYTFTPDPGFCPSPVSLTIEVLPNPDFTLENEYFLCFDTNSVIILPTTIDTGLNTPIYNFTWLLNSVPVVGANQGSYMPVEGGDYEVIVQNAMTMCESSMLTTVTVLTEPEFEAEVITDPFSENQIIQVTTISIGDFEYQLDAGSWQDESIFNNVSIGEHIVTVRDKRGCIESSRTVFVIGYPKYFTPNGDGYNETWNIVAPTTPINFLASAKIYIFDRYGKLLKQIDPTGEGWNGIYNGSNMSSDDYWFVVEYTDPNSLLRKEFKAHFALKR